MCALMKQRRLNQSFKDQDGIQIMKDSMASGFFARDRDSVVASASMVFVGNINQIVNQTFWQIIGTK
jgi:predicted ATP-dependent Lon-type protease